jgi:putative Mg2+ transporter-C (MgtC) family protein
MNEFGIDAEALVRVLAAIALGAVVGFEREANDQPAGLRTHISVALGACLFGIISTMGFEAFETGSRTNVRVEVTRVASQVVVGIGFIGAGVIFRHGATVRNLTTAASLWVTAAIGLAAGIGDVGLAAIVTVALVASLVLLRLPRSWIRRRVTRTTHELHIGLRPDADPRNVQRALETIDGIDIKGIYPEKHDGRPALRVKLTTTPRVSSSELLATIAARDDVVDLQPLADRELVAD